MSEVTETVETTDRPTSMADAFTQVDAPSSEATPAQSTPADTTEAATIAQPAAETPEPATVSADDLTSGEPPLGRWEAIKANIRKKTAEETAAQVRHEVEQQYSGLQDFRGMDANERAGLLTLNRALRGDGEALAYIDRVNPRLAAALRGEEPRATVATPDPEPQPDAAIQLADGSTMPVYTPEGQAKREAWLQKHLASTLKAQFAEEFKPLATTADKLRQFEQQAQAQAASKQWAAQVTAPLSKLPYFDEFKPQLGQALSALPPTATDSDMTAALYETYTRLHTAKLDQFTKDGETKALANLQQRAVSGTINPATATTTTPRRPKSMAEALEQQGAA